MAELVNEFSWSKSRDETFRKCPRLYYYQYYGSWGGWNAGCDDRTRELYVLKQLTSRAMWAGQKVHVCIERALENIRRRIDPMSEADAIATTLAVMRKDYANSRRGDYWRNPKTCGFFEHEYGLDLPDTAWKQTADHVVGCLQTFYRSEVYKEICDIPPSQWLDVEDFSSFQMDAEGIPGGVKVHVVLDFSYRASSGGIVIYDWKTGRSDSERNELQLACYTFYATEKWRVTPEEVTTKEFNLASGRLAPYNLRGVGLDAILQYMCGSIRDMRILLDDAVRNAASEERFAFAANESACRYCNFRKVCARWKKA